MKNKKLLFILGIFLLFFLHLNVHAKTVVRIIVPVQGVRLRKEPTSSSGILIEAIPAGSIYELVEDGKTDPTLGCQSGWYHVYYKGNDTGYVCADFADEYSRIEYDETTINECATDLKVKGFPDSYISSLCELKVLHPNWIFTPDFTNLEWEDAVFLQEYDEKSLIQSYNDKTQGYLDTTYLSYDYLTDTFIVKEGTNWYNASHETVAYFVDPRNFFNEKEIFIFQKLSFNEATQPQETIDSILEGTDIKEKSYIIYDAGRNSNVSPIYLASRIRLETTGNYNNYSIKGTSYGAYEHIYNPYNIGANTGAVDGIVWAAGSNGYNRPWTTLDAAIYGGASYIAESYIAKGQDTTYFQKFNTSSYSDYKKYTHQYQANVQGPATEAIPTYNSYAAHKLLDNSLDFVIPIYNNMPENPSPMPSEGNPNNHLKSITINGKELPSFNHDNFTYNYSVPEYVSSVKIEGTVINKNAKIEGTGDVSLPNEDNEIILKVTAQNGSVQNYTINIKRSSEEEIPVSEILNAMSAPVTGEMLIYGPGLTLDQFKSEVNKVSLKAEVSATMQNGSVFSTGDTITIINGSDSQTLNVAIKGDTNGDSNIDIKDLLIVQKNILGYTNLTGVYFKGGDPNQDGLVDIKDLLIIQKHILGYTTIG